LTGQQRLAGSEMALEERGRSPDLERQGCGEGAAAGGACVQRLLMRVQRAMVWVSDPAAKACWMRLILETVYTAWSSSVTSELVASASRW
jgi:hypothetical protein